MVCRLELWLLLFSVVSVRLKISVKNYRCFGGQAPSGFVLKRGITGFIGENNSGKSTMLRLFFDLRQLFADLAEKLEGFQPGDDFTFELPQLPEGVDRDRFFHLHNQEPLVVELESGGCELDLIFRRDGQIRWKCGNMLPRDSCIIRDLQTLSRMFYVGPFRPFQTHGSSGKSYDVIFGEPFFDQCRELYAGKSVQGARLLKSVAQDVAGIFGLDEFHYETGSQGEAGFRLNGDWMPTGELGSGIGQCFLIYLQAALKKPSFILVDEPEAHLHPSVQTDFVTQLAGYAQYGLVTSTHHTGLAQSISDHLYQVTRHAKEERSVIEPYRPGKRLSLTLGEMQVPVSSNGKNIKLLLVEGPTEIKALRKILAKIKRDHEVVLMPLGGSSMINGHREDELREVKKICDQVYALVDSEKRSERAAISPNHKAFRESCRKVGIGCHILKRRALENYFSTRAVKQVLGGKFRAPRPFEDLKAVNSKWPKSENWKIVQQMSREELEDTDLWKFCLMLVNS
jgi:energy-coupling factor transporter ATP-binding protein EcfA2